MPDRKQKRTSGSWLQIYKRLLASIGPYAPAMQRCMALHSVATMLQGFALACVLPLLTTLLDPENNASPLSGPALLWLASMAVLTLLSTLVRWRAESFDFRGDSVNATHYIRTRMGQKLREIALEQLQEQRSGELNAAFLGSVDEQLMYFSMVACLILESMLIPISAALVTCFYDLRLGLLLLALFPAIVLLYRWRRPAHKQALQEVTQAHEQVNADLLEYTQGLAVLRAALQVGAKAQTLQQSLGRLQAVQSKFQRRENRPALLIASVVELGLLLVIAIGASWVTRGSLELPVLAATLVIMVRFVGPLGNFVNYTFILSLIENAMDRIDALNAMQALYREQPDKIPQSYEIEFQGVDFKYGGTALPVLSGLSLRIPARSMTAIVGPSGSGKTTVTRLLMRHADPQNGSISIGGVPLPFIPTPDLFNLVSVVFQDVYLFDDTVRENIRMAKPGASDREITSAARQAHCLEFIERLPEGWNTRLGGQGSRLSGGERQRISIARALLKDAPIIILDEPTAALDTQSERAVQKAIDQLVRDRTVIVIAHRLSTIAAAEQILVLDEGHLVQRGRHEQLLAQDGRYRAMWSAQEKVKTWHARS